MKTNYKRVLALLLSILLVLGLMPSVFAATDMGDQAATGDSTETTESTDPGEEDIPEEWQQLLDELPEAIEVDGEYPYGVPVDAFFPEEMLQEDLNDGIMVAATMKPIPEEMLDNPILRALEYTGYDVPYLKQKGYLYRKNYIGSSLATNKPDALSPIDYGSNATGLETRSAKKAETTKYQKITSDGTTQTIFEIKSNGATRYSQTFTSKTGVVPDLSKFNSGNFVCAAFVTYYIGNYLPNIEGIDTSHIMNAVGAVDSGNYSWVPNWMKGLDTLAGTAGSGVTKHDISQGDRNHSNDDYSGLVPGDIIVFKEDPTGSSQSGWPHIAIYAGEYNLYSTSGTDYGVMHFIIHVGNKRGPEISVAEYMKTDDAKGSNPWYGYHLSFNDPTVEEHGKIEIYKKDPNGQSLAGAIFKATHQKSGEVYSIGPTNSSGYAMADMLPLGTYTVEETVFPIGYEASGATSWTATLTTEKLTFTINAVNQKITPDPGSITIQKATNTGANLGSWTFGVYTDPQCTQAIANSPFTTNTSGKIEVTNLLPGTYYVKELSSGVDFWATDNGVKTVKVESNKNTTVTVTNTHFGKGNLIKKTSTGKDLVGWMFNIYTDSGLTTTTDESPYVTDSSGKITANLEPGTYWVQEIDDSVDDSSTIDLTSLWFWDFDDTAQKITITAGQTSSVEFNNLQRCLLTIVKKTSNNENLEGWRFNIYKDQAKTQLVEGSPFETNALGFIDLWMLEGTYWVEEVDDSGTRPGWSYDTSLQKVVLKPGDWAYLYFNNIQQGRIEIIKTSPDDNNVEGFTFQVLQGTKVVGTYTTDSTGILQTGYLDPGTYTVEEVLSEESSYWCESAQSQTVEVKAGETAEVEFVNRLKPGKIAIYKVDFTGKVLADAEFLLEWSSNGTTWESVTYSTALYVGQGTCTSPDLKDGRLRTDKNGLAEFTGLNPKLQYRLTETEAPDGYMLLTEPVFQGQLSQDDTIELSFTVVNAVEFMLPATGSHDFVVWFLVTTTAWVAFLLYPNFKKRRR